MPKASINAIITIIRNAQRLGVDIDVLQERVGISSEILSDPDSRVDSLIGFRLMEEAEKLSNDPLFGLHHGSHFQPADMGLVGFLILNAPTLKHALDSFCKFQKIYGEGMLIKTEQPNNEIEVRFELHPSLPNVGGYSAFYSHMAGFISIINWLLNDKLIPLKVNIIEKQPVTLLQQKEFTKMFGDNIRYSTSKFSIVYKESCFTANVLTKNPELFKLFEHRAESIIRQFGNDNDFKSIVASCLLKTLDSGKPNLESVSKLLHKSSRSIQRLLKLEGTTFQTVLNEVREKSAKYYLETTSLNIDEIAYLLGFSDGSSFRKYFKKWTTLPPEGYRKKYTQA